MTRVIAVALSKGGTGKSTTAVSLAHALSLAGQRVLLVDTDTQGQTSYLLGVRPTYGLSELVSEKAAPGNCLTQARDNLFLLAGGRTLGGLKKWIDMQELGGERVLAEALAPILSSKLDDKNMVRKAEGIAPIISAQCTEKDSRGRFDFVLLDCAPSWDSLSVNSLFASDEVLAPVSLEPLSLQGLGEFIKSVNAIRRYKPGLRIKFVVPTFLDGRVRKSRQMLEQLQDHYHAELCAPVRYCVKLAECGMYGKTIFEYAPTSTGAEDYQALAERIAANGQG